MSKVSDVEVIVDDLMVAAESEVRGRVESSANQSVNASAEVKVETDTKK